jgi:hypothetical protein
VRVLPGSPIQHALVWDRLPGVAGYRVFKSIKGQWYPLTPQPILAEAWTDAALVSPGTLYRISAAYPDGRQGDTDFTYTNPPQPQLPTGFTLQRAGPGAVSLSWQPVPFAAFYRIFGTGRPVDGTVVNGTQTTFTNLPDGSYTWQLSADYGGVYGGGPSVSTTITSTGRYRVVANGFKVLGQTGELGLFPDGAGDEVYAGFAMFHLSRPQGQVLDTDLRRTVTHGDVAVGGGGVLMGGSQSMNAVQAGSASLTGGLRNGDAFPPVLDPSQRYGQAPGDQSFPFLVWHGSLTDGKDAVIILPSMWESDRKDGDLTNWFMHEQAVLPATWADLVVQQALGSNTIALRYPPGWTYFPPAVNLLPCTQKPDHPIGSIFDDAFRLGLCGATGKKLPRRAIILTREMIETALVTGNGIVPVPLDDIGSEGSQGNGHYVLYLQVERAP